MVVDGKPFSTALHDEPYGSSIEATGSGYGWFAVESRNPLLIAPKRLSEGQRRTLSRGAKQRHRARLRKAARRDVRHTRITLYKPNRAVVVLDRARAVHGSRRYERHLQLSRWAPYSDGNVFAMGAPMPISSRLASGELQIPEVETSAPYFPHKAMLERRHRLTFTSRGKAVDHILVLGIDGGTAYGEIAGGRIGKRATTIILHDRLGRPIEQRVIRREGTRLVVE